MRNAPNGRGWEIWTENARTSDSVALWAHEVLNGQDIEFRKAKFLAQYRYALGGLERLAPGSRVTFQWAQDAPAGHAAWVLPNPQLGLPYRDGLFRVGVNETFQAGVRFWNIADSTAWTSDARYRLGSWLPADNTTWGLSRLELPHSVPAAGAAEFTFTCRAPAIPGQYPFSWRMLQEGVEWFGEAWRLRDGVIAVEPPPPPPPPTSGEVTISLAQQDPASLTYDATSPDPSVTPAYPAPRHALIDSVRNDTDHALYLAHQDRNQQQTSYVMIPAHAAVTAPFASLEVEGRWRAQYRGAEPPPALTVVVAWRVP